MTDIFPCRIVSLQPSATVILSSIGELDRLVACTKYCAEVVPEMRTGRQKIIADSWTVRREEILNANPDLVIAAVPYQEKAVCEILRAGVRFLGLAPRTLADIYHDIAAISGMVGQHEKGQRVIQEMQAKIAGVRANTQTTERPTVFCEEWGKPLIASQPWVAELVDAAGGVFVGEAGKQISALEVAAADPDVWIAAWCGAGDRVPLQKIATERDWGHMRAIQKHQAFCIRDEYLNTPAPTLVQGLDCLAAALHPDRFPALPGLTRITEVSPHESSAPGLR